MHTYLVELCYDSNSRSAFVLQKGFHNSFVNGKPIGKGNRAILHSGDRLELLRGKYQYQFEFEAKIDPSINMSPWSRFGTDLEVLTPAGTQDRAQIAGFDLDGTIICTKSGLVFAKDEADWQFLFAEVPGKLRQMHENGYKLVIFTNQKGLQTGRQAVEPFRRKIEAILAKIPVPVQVIISNLVSFQTILVIAYSTIVPKVHLKIS